MIMPKCSNCGKSTQVLASYGDTLLCKECAHSYHTEGKWLIRTTDGKILGPYSYGPLREMIEHKKIVFLDEVSRSGEDWMLVKNVGSFKDLALQSVYELSEGTVGIDKTMAPEQQPAVEHQQHPGAHHHPPSFKHHKHKKHHEVAPDMIPTPILIQSPQPEAGDSEAGLWWWKNKRSMVIFFILTLIAVLPVTFYMIGHHNKESNMLGGVTAGTDAFNRYYIEGRELEDGGLFGEAIRYYDKALSLRSDHSGARIRRAAIDLVVGKKTDIAQKELEKLYSEGNIGKITDQDEQMDIKTFLGILEAQKGNNQSAIGYFNQALAVKPTNAYLYYNIGIILFKQGSYAEALEYFRNAQKLLPMFMDAVFYEGRSLMKLNRYRDAAKVFAEGASQNPNVRQFYTFGAYSVFKGQQGADKSLDVLKRITSIDPYYSQKIFSPLCQMEKDNTIIEEIDYVREMMKDFNDTQRTQGNYLLAMLYFSDGNFDAASKIILQSEKDNSAIGQLILGAIAYHQGRYDDAEKKIAKSLELDYSSNLAHIYAGQIALKRDDINQAKNHFTKAQATDEPASLYAITLLGDINIRFGEANQAMVLWKKVLSMDSHYMPAWQRVMETNKRINRN
jgi:tetratricopeptide (TPR) repeat protein